MRLDKDEYYNLMKAKAREKEEKEAQKEERKKLREAKKVEAEKQRQAKQAKKAERERATNLKSENHAKSCPKKKRGWAIADTDDEDIDADLMEHRRSTRKKTCAKMPAEVLSAYLTLSQRDDFEYVQPDIMFYSTSHT